MNLQYDYGSPRKYFNDLCNLVQESVMILEENRSYKETRGIRKQTNK